MILCSWSLVNYRCLQGGSTGQMWPQHSPLLFPTPNAHSLQAFSILPSIRQLYTIRMTKSQHSLFLQFANVYQITDGQPPLTYKISILLNMVVRRWYRQKVSLAARTSCRDDEVGHFVGKRLSTWEFFRANSTRTNSIFGLIYSTFWQMVHQKRPQSLFEWKFLTGWKRCLGPFGGDRLLLLPPNSQLCPPSRLVPVTRQNLL